MLRVWGSEDPDCRVQGTVLGSRIQWTQRESSPCSLCSDRQAGSRLLLPLCAPPLPVCAPPCHPLAEGRVHLNMDPTHCGNEILCGFICFVCLYKGMASVGNAGDKGEQCWGGGGAQSPVVSALAALSLPHPMHLTAVYLFSSSKLGPIG